MLIPDKVTLRSDTKGWFAFLDAIQVRNRITHPRSSKDLEISLSDIEKTRLAHRFIQYTANMCIVEDAQKDAEILEENYANPEWKPQWPVRSKLEVEKDKKRYQGIRTRLQAIEVALGIREK